MLGSWRGNVPKNSPCPPQRTRLQRFLGIFCLVVAVCHCMFAGIQLLRCQFGETALSTQAGPTLRVTSRSDTYTVSLTTNREVLLGVIKCYGLNSSDAKLNFVAGVDRQALDHQRQNVSALKTMCYFKTVQNSLMAAKSRLYSAVKHSHVMLLSSTKWLQLLHTKRKTL